ncbi:MAG: GDP-mannose 4,6-dehydratase [Henriciella sp.]|uniref:GDP-mannose 4,6-dehydratase n=1 Tax=Henriciella sp. TaxID=1968823 RepID=UPI003C743E2E
MSQRTTSRENPLLITGGTGFVGRHLVLAAAEHGLPADAIVAASPRRDADLSVRQEAFDMTDAGSIFQLIEKVKPKTVVHLAAIAAPGEARANYDAAWSINFEGTRKLAEAILKHAPEARLVFAGSAEAYGESFNSVEGPISEDATLRPASTYGATKAAADIMLGQLQAEGLDVIRTRSFNHSGPGQTTDYVVPAFAEQIANAEARRQDPVIRVGNLDAKRDFLDVRDVAKAYVAMALADGVHPDARVINVASGSAVRIQHILDTLIGMAAIEISVDLDRERLRPSDVPHAAGDNQRLIKYFGWSPRYELAETLADTLNFYRS